MARNIKGGGKKGAKGGGKLKRGQSPTREASVISASELDKVIRKCRGFDKSAATERGHKAAALERAVSEHNLHKGALRWIIQLEGMDAIKLGEWLFHFDTMRKHRELDKLAAAELPLDDREDANADDLPIDDRNVTKLPTRGSQPEAGAGAA